MRKETDHQTGEISERLIGWIAAPIFSQDQLVGDGELPKPRHPLEGDFETLYLHTRITIATTGILVDEEPLPIGVHGMSMGGRIVNSPKLSTGEKLLCAWHEWGHELLHRDEDRDQLSKTQKELEAESVSLLMARLIGLDNPFSRDYILHYHGTVEDFHARPTRIHTVVKRMYGLLHVEPIKAEISEAA